jgi:hypothetical protein
MGKKKVTKKQFAEILFYWVSSDLTEKNIKRKAKELGFRIRPWRSIKDFNKLFFELLILDMWLIEYTCENFYSNDEEKFECEELFNQLIYDRYVDKERYSYKEWTILVTSLLIGYDEAIKTDHPSTPLWIVTNVINRRLFGEINKSLSFQMTMIAHIELFIEYLGGALINYEVE